MKKLIGFLTLIYLTLSSLSQASETMTFTKDLANEIAIYAMMASNAYVNDKSKTHFPIEALGWKKVDLEGNPVAEDKNSYTSTTWIEKFLSNLQFDIWEDTKSNRTIIAFKGTDEPLDIFTNINLSPISIPHLCAKKLVKIYLDSHTDRTLSLTGHSLGGSLALSVSLRKGIDTIIFNSSPRAHDGRKNSNEPAYRLAVFQEGDTLQNIRKWYPKFLAKIKPEQIVETHFNYLDGNPHRSDLLAEGILSCATKPDLQEIAKKMKLVVKCPLN